MKKIIIGLISMSALIFTESHGMKVHSKGLSNSQRRIFQPPPSMRQLPEHIESTQPLTMEDFIEYNTETTEYRLRDPEHALSFIEFIRPLWESEPTQREIILRSLLVSYDPRSMQDYTRSTTIKALATKFKRDGVTTIVPNCFKIMRGK